MDRVPSSDSRHVDVVRCPACQAAVRPGSPWCSLCYADLRPKAPAPVRVPQPRVGASAYPAPVGQSAVAAAANGPHAGSTTMSHTSGGWPCGTCRTTVSIELSACPTCGSAFLESLKLDAQGRHRSVGAGEKSTAVRRSISRPVRLGLALLLGLLVAILVPVLLALLG
jgi:hypothetical protein